MWVLLAYCEGRFCSAGCEAVLHWCGCLVESTALLAGGLLCAAVRCFSGCVRLVS